MDKSRSVGQRQSDTLEKLQTAVDMWVATASQDGQPHLVPLSFVWDGERIVISVSRQSRTARNIAETGRARLCLGPTRDVVVIEGPAEIYPIESFDASFQEEFAAKVGFDPHADARSVYVRITPHRIQAWHEVNEIEGRDLMLGGEWRRS